MTNNKIKLPPLFDDEEEAVVPPESRREVDTVKAPVKLWTSREKPKRSPAARAESPRAAMECEEGDDGDWDYSDYLGAGWDDDSSDFQIDVSVDTFTNDGGNARGPDKINWDDIFMPGGDHIETNLGREHAHDQGDFDLHQVDWSFHQDLGEGGGGGGVRASGGGGGG